MERKGNLFHFKELTMKKIPTRNVTKVAVYLGRVLCLAVLVAVFTQLALVADTHGAQQQRQRRARPEPKVKVGELAPDFELPYLVLSTDATGKPIGKINDDNKFRLSSLFGKKPVCMIMSSYT